MAYTNRKFNWDLDALKRFYDNYVIKWLTSSMNWSEAKMKQARANLGFGNGDIDNEPTAGSDNLIKSGGVERFVNQSVPYLTLSEGTEAYTYHSVKVKAGHTYRIKKTESYAVSSVINIYFRIDQTSTSQQVVELHGNVDYVDFTAERDYEWLLFYNATPTTGGTEEIYFYDLNELILSRLNEITPKVFDGVYSTADRNTIVKNGIYKNTDGFYVMLVFPKVGETSSKVQFEFGYYESTTVQNWTYRKRTGVKNQQNEWVWTAWTDKFSEISTELTNIINDCVKLRTVSSTNCDEFTSNGIYKVNVAFENVPEDMDNNGSLLSFKNDTDARLCHILAQNMSGLTSKLWFRTMNTSNVFGKWMRLATNTISISYVSEGIYSIIFGKYKLNLFYTSDNSADQHNWNIGEIKLNDVNRTVIVPSGTDIIGPIKVSGDADFISGVHGSSTTTGIKVYCDGKDVTLNSALDKTCEKIVIFMIDECRREVSPQTHVFDRFVTIEITRNRIHIQNTFKNVSGETITVERATNGGLIAVRNNILSSTSMPNLMLIEAPSAWIENKSPLNTSVVFNLTNIGSIKVTNILGHEQSTYRGFYNVFVNETPIRTKSYFDIIATNTDVPANGIIAGEFEYLFE